MAGSGTKNPDLAKKSGLASLCCWYGTAPRPGEKRGAANLHEAKELLIQHRYVTITGYGLLQREEEDGPKAAMAAEAAPHDHTGQV
jgi:hypothetical protein